MSNLFWSQTHLSSRQIPLSGFPSLLMGSTNQLLQLTYQASQRRYELVAEIDLWDNIESFYLEPTHLQKLSDSLIIATGINHLSRQEAISRQQYQATTERDRLLLKLSPNLEIIAVQEYLEIAAMIATDDWIWLCTEGQLIILDNNLNSVAAVDLNLPEMMSNHKNAHDIILYNNIAYLLDNVVEPTYILTVDISNPRHPQILNTIELIGVNHHLKHQWLNPALQQWYIVQNYSTQAASGENIIILPLTIETDTIDLNQAQFTTALTPYNPQSILLAHQAIAYCEFSELTDYTGISIITATALPPLWAVIYENQTYLYFAAVDSANNIIRFTHKLTLGRVENCQQIQAQIQTRDRLAFVMIKVAIEQEIWTRFFIVEINPTPQIVFNQDFTQWGDKSPKIAYCLQP